MQKTPLRERVKAVDWPSIAFLTCFIGIAGAGAFAVWNTPEDLDDGDGTAVVPVVDVPPEAERQTLIDVIGPGNNIEVYEYFTSRGDFCTVSYTYPGHTSTVCDWVDPQQEEQLSE